MAARVSRLLAVFLNAFAGGLGLSVILLAALVGTPAQAADELEVTVEEADAVLVDDFVAALDLYASDNEAIPAAPGIKLWLDGMRQRGIDTRFVRNRLAKAKAGLTLEGADPFARYRRLNVETVRNLSTLEVAAAPAALHAFRIDVVEDYDDAFNDDIYCYFITTHDDLIWGRVTSVYSGIDQGQSFFFAAEDRGLFGPKGDKMAPKNHTLVDFGIVESDSGDIKQLQELSDVIVDLALVALTAADAPAGVAAAQARAEVQNLLRLVIGMDDDDRLVTDTLRFTPQSMNEMLAKGTVYETSRFYEQEDFWTHFAYRIHFRLLR